MSRTVRDTNLETRAARLRLTTRRKPYWRVVETGLHLDHSAPKSGAWVTHRFIGEGKYLEVKVGTADDLQDADGVALHSFKQAQEAARHWWRAEQRRALGHAPDDGPYTVTKALKIYSRTVTGAARRGWQRTAQQPGFASSRRSATWTWRS